MRALGIVVLRNLRREEVERRDLHNWTAVSQSRDSHAKRCLSYVIGSEVVAICFCLHPLPLRFDLAIYSRQLHLERV